jgi:chromate reductase
MTFTVGYLIGSLSVASINRIIARALVRLAPPEWNMVEIPIKDLPVTDETTEMFLREFMEQFEQFMERVFTVLPRASEAS